MGPFLRRLAITLTLASLFASACVDDDGIDGVGNPDANASAALIGEVVVEGLSGPTQLTVDAEGFWWVAQLAGGENDGSGQVARLDPDSPDSEPEVVLDGLDKPTGIALFAGELWVMERNRLTRGSIGGAVDGSDRVIVADDLPTNGRSEGTLTVDGDRLLYDTSGRLEVDGTPTEGSGTLWAITADGEITSVATGFKHAYAHARTDDGTLYTTEVGDGRYDGERPQDELVPVTPDADHGWPRCVGDNRVVIEYGGTESDCAAVPRPLALFPAGATPTSVVVPPWDSELLLVALWNEGQVAAVSTDAGRPAGNDSGDDVAGYDVVYTGAEHPQHLVVDGDRVLLTDHIAGRIIALRRGGSE